MPERATPDLVLTIPLHVEALEVERDLVLVDLSTGAYFVLNRVGAHMWKLLAEGLSVGRVAAQIATEYGVPRERVDEDLGALLTVLRERRLVEG